MMQPERIFAKLATRVPPIANMGGATGAPEIDTSMAAGICASLTEKEWHAAMMLYACCDASREWVRIRLHMEAMELSQRFWKHSPQWVKLAEQIKAHTGMPASIAMANLAVVDLTHRAQYLAEDRYAALGVSRWQWYSMARRRYNEVAVIPERWAEGACKKVMEAQREVA